MQPSKPITCAVFIAGLLAFIPGQAPAQDAPPPTDSTTTTQGIVRGQPFSAIRYVRKVKILPDGKQKFLRNDRYPAQMARDSEGRIRIESIQPQSECDRPEQLEPPPCPAWSVLLFDLTARRITSWLDGAIAAHGSVIFRLSDQQLEDAENATNILPVYAPVSNWDGATFTTKHLGDKVIEGIRATGIRITKEIPAGRLGNNEPIVTIREVWTSASMKLILQVIDGDPRGEETISGFEHVSLTPNPALFQSPDGYQIQQQWNTDQSWQRAAKYVDNCLENLAEWFPSQAATPPQQ
jgi:hypothetical protein